MPIYQFTCKKCGTTFEEILKVEDKYPPCPACRSEEVVKNVTGPSVAKEGGCGSTPRKSPFS